MTPRPHPLRGPNRFKLGIFSANADGGLALTTVPERWPARWDDIVRSAQIADRAGIELFLPIARWKGFGGATEAREWSFETFTFAAALAGTTERIALFSTVHVPLVHPVFAAKALATIDHASHGRAGLNIVCGWNPDELGMFGQGVNDDRYGQGEEWWQIVRRIHALEPPFDFAGRYYDLRRVAGKPAPLQSRVVTVNAAFGAPGRDFAARNCDFLLTVFADLESARQRVADIRARAQRAGARSASSRPVMSFAARPTRRPKPTIAATRSSGPTTPQSTITWPKRRNSRRRTTSRRTPATSSALRAARAPIR